MGGNRMSLPGSPLSQTKPPIDFATLDLLPYGIIVLDRHGTILFYNRREEEIARRSRLDVLGKNFFADVAPCTQLSEFWRCFEETIESDGHTAEFRFHFPFEPSPRDVEVALSSFRYGGELLCLVSIRDLTEEADLRDQIRIRERFSDVGEVAAGVAHNFNNILMAIRVWAQVLVRLHPPGTRSGDAVAHILKAAGDGTRMIERIREGVRQAPEPKEMTDDVDVCAVAGDAVALVALRVPGRHIEIVTTGSPVPPIRGNASEIQEVVVNLLTNALDAIEGPGRVTIHTSSTERAVILEVTDTGGGMSDEVQRKLFRPLFTTKGEEGTGLGLSTSYAIIRRHDGEIRVRSSVGAGTTFSVILPRHRA